MTTYVVGLHHRFHALLRLHLGGATTRDNVSLQVENSLREYRQEPVLALHSSIPCRQSVP